MFIHFPASVSFTIHRYYLPMGHWFYFHSQWLGFILSNISPYIQACIPTYFANSVHVYSRSVRHLSYFVPMARIYFYWIFSLSIWTLIPTYLYINTCVVGCLLGTSLVCISLTRTFPFILSLRIFPRVLDLHTYIFCKFSTFIF